MNTILKLVKKQEAKSRRLRRFVESTAFAYAYKKAVNKEVANKLVVDGDITGLKLWTYRQSGLLDAPCVWLRRQAQKHNIPNYSRKMKVELVSDLIGIDEYSIRHDAATATADRGS